MIPSMSEEERKALWVNNIRRCDKCGTDYTHTARHDHCPHELKWQNIESRMLQALQIGFPGTQWHIKTDTVEPDMMDFHNKESGLNWRFSRSRFHNDFAAMLQEISEVMYDMYETGQIPKPECKDCGFKGFNPDHICIP